MASESSTARPRIAVFSGPTATIQVSPPLVTSHKARVQHGLSAGNTPDGRPAPFDVLRPQRLAAPVTVYIEQFTAHPMERDAAELYAPPDGYVSPDGAFHPARLGKDDRPVYAVTLRPEDGLYPLPYMGRQANGQPWEDECAYPGAPAQLCRQAFYPDAARIFEEIDRLGVGLSGVGNLLSSRAEFDFYRAAPSAGYRRGLRQAERTDVGAGDISPEALWDDFYPYRPSHLNREPAVQVLARLTNVVRRAMQSDAYSGAMWLEGTPFVEETSYWLNLLIDTAVPIVGTASQRPHGAVGNDGDRNIVDTVDYILSRIWADEGDRDGIGVVVVVDQQIITAREIQKGDARPGGYVATGGQGGVIGTIPEPGFVTLSFKPLKRHTRTSAVRMSLLPNVVNGVQRAGDEIHSVPVVIKTDDGELVPTALPRVTIFKHARYLPDDTSASASSEVDILARIEQNLHDAPLSGFVGEGSSPYGGMTAPVDAALERAVLSGMPVVKVGRGNADGVVPPRSGNLFIAGSNLTATKARLLLMACLLRFGGPPPARDLGNPTPSELAAIRARLADYQAVFNTH
jgi:hypothetical protein